jgi:uncharacterized protein (DUF58 family)
MIPKELIRKIRRIEISTNRLVNDVFSGQYHSTFKGQGMEFIEVREYQPGDDVRNIDWNVTARYGFPFIKKFREERELTVVLLVDLSRSGMFGTTRSLKEEIAAEIGALLAFSAIKNNDKVGLVLFTDQVEKFVPPKKGQQHVLRLIREMLYFKPQGRGTDIDQALTFLSQVLTKRAVVFLISDFLNKGFERSLKMANRRHDIVAIKITDPREVELPKIGLIELEDSETGEQMLIDTNDLLVREYFCDYNAQEEAERNRLFRSINIDHIDILTSESYVEPLVRFFRMRAKRLR